MLDITEEQPKVDFIKKPCTKRRLRFLLPKQFCANRKFSPTFTIFTDKTNNRG